MPQAKCALHFFVLLVLLTYSISSYGQMIGGTSTGQMTPKEAQAGSIISGGVSGDVNMFTGTFNASYDLGSVSTLSGLSFNLSMSYNSTFASGDNVPTLTGVPYGEGWSLNVPTITVSSEDYNKYSARRRKYMAANRRPVYLSSEAQKEGDLYWFEPMMNIPGVGGGRMVLKRTIAGGNKHVFVLHKFDRYIEAIFDGKSWEIILDDGTRYEFSPMVKAHREASNQRVHPTDGNCTVEFNPGYPATGSLVMPKTEYLSWYCTSIWHPDLVGRISFAYNYYGQDIDFFKRYKQPLHQGAHDFLDDLDLGTLPQVYRDVHLSLVKSSYERLQLTYEEIDPGAGEGLLDVNDIDVLEVDGLYAAKKIYSSYNGAGDFSDWYRYRHIKDVNQQYDISPTNPYLKLDPLGTNCGLSGRSIPGEYFVEPAGSGIFDHAFLESPRLNPFASFYTTQGGNAVDNLYMPPGEIYEVRATISGGNASAALFDVNIASGDFSVPHTMPSGGSAWLPACEFQDTRGHTIHSTFDKAVKWHSRDGTNANVSEFFVLPNNPQAYAGFNIQIGPANSDTDYSAIPDQIYVAGSIQNPVPTKSYFNYGTGYGDGSLLTELYGSPDSEHNGHDNGIPITAGGPVVYPTDRISSNFGIGMPWHNMLDFYEISDPLRSTYCPEQAAPKFWWNTIPSTYSYPNQPTQVGTDYTLTEVELWRYSKRPLMLVGVTKQNYTGGETTTFNPDNIDAGWETVANLHLEYSIDPVAITNTVVSNGVATNESTGYYRNIVRLDRVVVPPTGVTNVDGANTTYPTTHFTYSNVSELIRLGDVMPTYFFDNPIEETDTDNPYYVEGDLMQENYFKVLTGVVNPLGQVTRIQYQPVNNEGGNSYTIAKYLGTKGLAYEPPLFYNKLLGERTYKVPGYAVQTYMIVQSKEVDDKDEIARWTYDFSQLSQNDNSVPLEESLRLSDPDRNRDFGFGKTIAFGPNSTSIRTEYDHSTNWLLWGKLLASRSYDANGSKISETTVEYEPQVAFEPVQMRLAPDFQDNPENNVDHYYNYRISGRPSLPSAIYDQGPSENFDQYYNALLYHFYEVLGTDPAAECAPDYDITQDLSDECYDLIFNRPVNDPFYDLLTNCNENASSFDPNSSEHYECIQVQICLDEYLSLMPVCENGAFYDFSSLPPNIRSNDGGEFETPYYYLGEPKFFNYARQVNPSSLYSYFIKKTSETSTTFDQSCNGANGGFTSRTEYEYYDADYRGRFTGTGYDKLGVIGEVFNGENYLNWEPSWQIYKVKQSSPSVPNWGHTEEYFYVYDLINHPAYQDATTNKPLQGMLRQIFDVKKRRDLVFEKRVTREGSGGGENVHSTFYVYDDDWTPTLPTSTVRTFEGLYGDGTCEDEDDGSNTGGGGVPPYSLCTTSPQGNQDLCQVPGSNLYCPCEIIGQDDSGTSSSFTTGSADDSTGGTDVDPGDVEEYLANFVLGNIYLKQTYIQTADYTSGAGNTLISFQDPSDFSQATIECPHLLTHTINSRNQLGQVVEEVDEKGLVTRIDYGDVTIAEYDYCSDGQVYRQSQIISFYPGLPKSITVGAELEFALTTEYGYHPSRQVASITDPNNIVLAFSYDDYNRLIEKKRNGKLIQELTYSNWPNDEGMSFTERALTNTVSVKDFTESTDFTVNTQYIDPRGRNVYTTSDGGGSSPLVTDNYFDIYGRVELAGPPTGSLPGANELDTGLEETCIGMDYLLDVAPRSRPIRAAKNDLCLNDDPNVLYEYCIISVDDIITEHTANGGNPDDFGDVLPSAGSVLKTTITDEDGKKVIEYTNGIGQKVATLGGGIGGVAYSYDEFGNVSRTVNAESQESVYTYNYLGLLHLKVTVDDGTTRYSYNPSGQMITMETSEYNQIWGYDEFGRMTSQKQVTGAIDSDNGGLPWVDDPTMGTYFATLASSIPEKEWYYNRAADNPSLNEGFESYLAEMNGVKGKVAQTISYLGEDPVESRLLSYNADGFLEWEMIRYLGFSSDLRYQLAYKDYNLQGSYKEQQVNLNSDGNIDFTYRYKYDGRNRIDEVLIDYPSLSVFNAKIASYNYHPSYLSVAEKALHDYEFGLGCTAEGVEIVTYEYDTRQRMKSLGSNLFAETLYYDGENYNGNIDATEFQYRMDRFTDVPLIFSGNTAYSYQYDGMNRLTKAEASVGFDLIDAHLYSGDFAEFGDVNYQYDRVGNIMGMSRGIIDHELKRIGFEQLTYELEEGNNKLTTLRYTGLNGIEEAFAYGYNGVGCLVADDRRGIAGIDYMRGVYPMAVGNSAYLYDVNDMRIARSGDVKEYYLRDAAGKELAIFNSDDGISWYVHGNERVAKIAADRCGESACRPKKPECSSETAQRQADQLAAIPYASDPNALVYPNLLVRVQFCDGKDRYLLFEELKLVDGPYNILQQIVLTDPNQVLAVSLNDDPVDAMLLQQFLDVRVFAETLNVNNYQDCAVFCPAEIYSCSEDIASTQLAYLNQLHDELSQNISGLILPDKLHRFRMCNGIEVYLLEQQLSAFPGFGMILQTVDFGSLDDEFMVSTNGAASVPVLGSDLLRNYLAETQAEIRIDGYVPCYEDLPCDPSLPDCSLADALNGGPNLDLLQEAIANTSTVPAGSTYPIELYRLRFCDGQELYVLDSELPLIAASNYRILQHLFIPSIGTLISARTTANENDYLSINQILNLRTGRNAEQLISLDNYESCGQAAECEGPICSPAVTEQQTVILDQLEAEFATRDPNSVTYPNTIYRLRFCEGREMYFLADELPSAPAQRVVQQVIELESANTFIDLVNVQGQVVPGTLADFIAMRGGEKLYTIGSFVPCRYRPQQCRTPEPQECGPDEIADQLIVFDQIRNTTVLANQLSYPLELTRVALCNGKEVYLLDSEIAMMPHTLTILQTIPVTSGFTPEYQLWLYNGGIVDNQRFSNILNERFNDEHLNFTVLGYGCEAVRKGNDTNCQYDIYLTDLALGPVANDPQSIEINATFDWERFCDDNTVQGAQGVVATSQSSKSCLFMEYRFDLSDMGSDDVFSLDRLGFSTRNPNGRLVVDLNPNTVLSTYPGLTYTADNGIIQCGSFITECPDIPSADDFYLSLDELTEPCCTQYMNVLNSTLDYAQSAWANQYGGTTQGSPFEIDFDPVGKVLSIRIAIQHYLSEPYLNIDHLQPEAVGSIKGSEKQINATVHKVLTDCNIGVNLNLCDESQYIDLTSALPNELPLDDTDIDEWYSLEEQILCCSASSEGEGGGLPFEGQGGTPTEGSGNSSCCASGPLLITTSSCTDYAYELECDLEPDGYCVDGICEGCPTPTDLDCAPEDIEPTRQALAAVDQTLSNSTAGSYAYPTVLYQLEFCGDERRYLFREELALVSDLSYTVRQRIDVESAADEFRLTLVDASALISDINDLLAYRKESLLARVDPLPELNPPPGNDTPNDGGSETELFTTGYEQNLQISYYLYDHLGNTRIVFHTELDCAGEIDYVAEYVADYYPYGKILREWAACDVERYLTTYHERDKESGYDYRGARFYDSDLGRFLSTDPLAVDFPMWSTYHYVLNNPIRLVDKDGRKPTPPQEIVDYRKIVATPLPGNGIRITETYVREETVVKRFVNSESGARGAFVESVESILTVTIIDINDQGQILDSSQEHHSERQVLTAGAGMKTTDSQCFVRLGEEVDLSGPLGTVVRDARSFYEQQKTDNPLGTIRNYNYKASGNMNRGEQSDMLTYGGAVVAGWGIRGKNPWVTGVGAAISIIGALPVLGREDESSVIIYEHNFENTEYD